MPDNLLIMLRKGEASMSRYYEVEIPIPPYRSTASRGEGGGVSGAGDERRGRLLVRPSWRKRRTALFGVGNQTRR